MRMMSLICVFIAISHLAGCDVTLEKNKSHEEERPTEKKNINPYLLSMDGRLFLLSTYFGVCVKDTHVLRSTYSNGMPSPHFPTYVEFVGEAGGFTISVGDVAPLPDAVVKDVPATSLPRRIRFSRWEGLTSLLVSDFDGAGKNVVSIAYDDSNTAAQAEAMRLANSIVACHLVTERKGDEGYR